MDFFVWMGGRLLMGRFLEFVLDDCKDFLYIHLRLFLSGVNFMNR